MSNLRFCGIQITARSDIFIMQRRKRLPNIVLKQTGSDFHPPTRRRNLSLSSNPTHPPEPPHPPSQTNIKLQVLTRCYSRKNKFFLFSDKGHRARDLTKLCQENVSQYLSIKNSMRKVETVRRPSVQSQSKKGDAQPKLSIKLLHVPLNMTLKNTFYPHEGSTRKLRMRTEHSPTKHSQQRVSLHMDRLPLPAPIPPLSPKKYNELTLREIVESQEEVSQRLQLFQKIRSLKQRLRQGVFQATERREEEPLAGW